MIAIVMMRMLTYAMSISKLNKYCIISIFHDEYRNSSLARKHLLSLELKITQKIDRIEHDIV